MSCFGPPSSFLALPLQQESQVSKPPLGMGCLRQPSSFLGLPLPDQVGNRPTFQRFEQNKVCDLSHGCFFCGSDGWRISGNDGNFAQCISFLFIFPENGVLSSLLLRRNYTAWMGRSSGHFGLRSRKLHTSLSQHFPLCSRSVYHQRGRGRGSSNTFNDNNRSFWRSRRIRSCCRTGLLWHRLPYMNGHQRMAIKGWKKTC